MNLESHFSIDVKGREWANDLRNNETKQFGVNEDQLVEWMLVSINAKVGYCLQQHVGIDDNYGVSQLGIDFNRLVSLCWWSEY